MKSEDTNNTMLLQGLEDGRSLSPSQDITDLSGQEAARVHPGASPQPSGEGRGRKTTNAISGQSGTLTSETLQSLLENRLAQRLPYAGMTDWPMTWKQRVTPSGRRICQLYAPVRRKGDQGFSLLPSIAAREWKDWSRARVLGSLDRGDGVAKRICRKSLIALFNNPVCGLNPLFGLMMMGLTEEQALCILRAMQ